MALAIKRDEQRLLDANAGDVENAKARGLDPAMIDRLALTPKSIASMAEGLLQIAALADPVGEISDLKYRPSGIQVRKWECPSAWSASLMKRVPTSPRMRRDCASRRATPAILRRGSSGIPAIGHRRMCKKGLKAAGCGNGDTGMQTTIGSGGRVGPRQSKKKKKLLLACCKLSVILGTEKFHPE